MCIPYFMEYRSKDGTISSVDMVTVDGKFYGRSDDVSERFFSFVRPCLLSFSQWVSYKLGSYRYQYSIECSNGCSFWFGLGFNSPSDSYMMTCNYWRIEFNPNKVFEDFIFLKIYTSLLRLSRNVEIKRFDLAVDYPLPRSSCFLVKDGRTYSEYTNSIEDRTQNLGQRSHHGFVKLYNKQIESKLPIPFTRLELTIDYKQRLFSDVEKIFPKVYIVESFQMQIENMKLTDTDRFILITCLENPSSIKMLGRGKQKKIESIMQKYSRFMELDRKAYNYILGLLDKFVNTYFLLQLIVNADEIPLLNEFYKPSDFNNCTAEDVLFDWGVVRQSVGGDDVEL